MKYFRRAGVTLTELMIAMTVITLGVVGSMGGFKYINAAITQSRLKTIATNLAQEQMEVLKNKTYYQLLVTTHSTTTTGYPTNFSYDTQTYPPQTITLWGFPALTRAVNVDYVTLNGSVATVLPYGANDPGMKKISVYVMWTDVKGVPRKVQLDSYYENPNVATMSTGIKGTVTNAANNAPISGALVRVMGTPKWSAYTDVSGNYTFQVVPGTYSLVCSSQVYYSTTTPVFSIPSGPYVTKNFTLNKIPTGSVSGTAYLRDHLVISQVVGSSVDVSGFAQEWIEVYNPTTWTWTMATGLNSGRVGVAYKLRNQSGALIDVDYNTLTVAPQRYFLFANTGTVAAGGATRAADAVFRNTNPSYPNLLKISSDPGNDAAEVTLVDLAHMAPLDKVAWKTGGQSFGGEGEPIEQNIGLELNEQFVRRTVYGAAPASGVGRAYDSNDNNTDFYVAAPISYAPKNSSSYDPTLSGTPAAGAAVMANDGLSTFATVSSTGAFHLVNVATSMVQGVSNTVTVTISSYAVLGSSEGITVLAGQNKDLGAIALSSSTGGGIVTGFVFGNGPDYYKRLGNPSIKVGCGGVSANTDSQGFYMLLVPTGTVNITANFGGDNINYMSSEYEANTTAGAVTELPDFHLSQGGSITGYVTSGTGAMPNIVVKASNGGPVYEDTSDTSGRFYLYVATSSIGYTITPDLDPLQSFTAAPSNPLVANMSVAGSSVFAGTITVVGAMGTIAGTVNSGGKSITTGVLVVASTAAVPDPLPSVTASNAPSKAIFYSVSSQADGTYSLDVRSSTTATYNMRAFYPVVDVVSGAVNYSSRISSAVAVSAGAISQRNFTW